MKNNYFALLSLLLMSGFLFAQTPLSVSTIEITGSQEVLPVTTAASGSVTVTIFDDLSISLSGSFDNLSSPVRTDIAGGMHIHLGYPGQNGPVIQPINIDLAADSLSGTIDPANNTFPAPAALFTADDGQVYFNLHTRNNPGGELRGVIFGPDFEVTLSNLLGSNENPAVNTEANGGIFAELVDNELFLSGSFQNLSSELNTAIAGGTHIHLGLPGQNGPVVFLLNTTVGADNLGGIFESENNTFTLTDEQVAQYSSGQYYVNIHSLNHPAGELRGQLMPLARNNYRAHLSGSNEWPVVNTGADGLVNLSVAPDSTLVVSGTFDNLSSPVATNIAGGAHLHLGLAGQNGPITVFLNLSLDADSLGGSFEPALNTFALTGEQYDALLARNVYLNIHTANFPTGELRGQVLGESQYVYTAYLNGNQEIPAILTPARGMVKIERNGGRMTASGSFTGLGSDLNVNILGGAHLHAGYAGQGGPVLVPLTVDQSDGVATRGRFQVAANTFPLAATLNDTLADRRIYVNIHSLNAPGGELRGHVLGEAQTYYYAPISSASQTNFTPEAGTGMVAAEVNDSTVILSGSFNRLSSPFNEAIAGGMHLHTGLAGSNGPIAAMLRTEIATDGLSGVLLPDSNTVAGTQALIDAMNTRGIYANIHTVAYPSGELRGQVLPLAGTYFHSTLRSVNSIPTRLSAAQGGLKYELTNNILTVSGSVSGLESDFNIGLAQGAHLHFGTVSQTGGISIRLNPTVADNNLSVDWLAEDNVFPLDSTTMAAIYASGLYANIHTIDNPSGEVRGQLRGDINTRPTSTTITSPADGATLTLSGAANQAFAAQWTATTDADGDTVVYVWQLATDADFTNIIFATNTATDISFTTDFATVDMLLESAGIMANGTADVYHRVIATDGSNHRTSAALRVNLTRGELVSLTNNQPLGFAARLFPNVAGVGQPVSLELSTAEPFAGSLFITDQLGRQISQQTITGFNGTQIVSVPTDRLPAGSYYVMLRLENGALAYATRLIVQ